MKNNKGQMAIGIVGLIFLSIANIVITFIIILIAVLLGIIITTNIENRKQDNKYLSNFHSVYNELCEENSCVVLLDEDRGPDGIYASYYIKCDFPTDSDCFSELVDVQLEINNLINARKDDEWYRRYTGRIEVYTDCQRLCVCYDEGSMTGRVWIRGEISNDYHLLWKAFPNNDNLHLYVCPDNYSDELKSEIEQKYDGLDIKVSPNPY